MAEPSAEAVIRQHASNAASAVSAFKRELHKVRTGRASTGLLEGVTVDYYGSQTALGHLGQISAPEAQLLLVQVYDAQAAPAVEKAILSSGLGFNPSREGNVIRINVPPLNEERRREIVKHLHKMAEDIRVSIRNHRRDANDALKALEKEGEIAKDDAKRFLEKIQQQTDKHIRQVDELLEAKEAEVMEV